MGFKMTKNLYENKLTPGRYPVQNICPPKKNGVIFLFDFFNRQNMPSTSKEYDPHGGPV